MSRDELHGGRSHKAVSVFLRLGELSSAVIVLGILSRFAYLLGVAQVHADSRIVYAMVTAGIGILFSLLFCPPFDSLFMVFPFDFILWIMWLVAFCLLETRTSSGVCSARWYNDYWGYYWGRYWRVGGIGTVNVNRAGCGEWRTTLAFSFVASFLHLVSGILGIYVFHTYVHVAATMETVKHTTEKLSKSSKKPPRGSDQIADAENGASTTQPPPKDETQPSGVRN